MLRKGDSASDDGAGVGLNAYGVDANESGEDGR